MLGRFFRGGKVRPGFFFSAGENLYWYTFSGGDSIPGRFFRGEVLCGGKLYATTPVREYAISGWYLIGKKKKEDGSYNVNDILRLQKYMYASKVSV